MLHVLFLGFVAIGERDVTCRNDTRPLVVDGSVDYTLRLGQEVKVLGAHDLYKVVHVRRLTDSENHV